MTTFWERFPKGYGGKNFFSMLVQDSQPIDTTSVVDPHHFYAAPARSKNFDTAPAPTLLHSKAKVLKRTEV
jgi:hypothetical protein